MQWKFDSVDWQPAVHSSAIRRLAADLVAAYCWTVPGRRDGLLPLAGWVNRG